MTAWPYRSFVHHWAPTPTHDRDSNDNDNYDRDNDVLKCFIIDTANADAMRG